jgi:hypothetical protein
LKAPSSQVNSSSSPLLNRRGEILLHRCEIAALRQEIARLQADQGALLKSQQEQLALLQKKLAEETKLPKRRRRSRTPASGTDSRVIAVEPPERHNPHRQPTSAGPAARNAANPRKPPSLPRPKRGAEDDA